MFPSGGKRERGKGDGGDEVKRGADVEVEGSAKEKLGTPND